MPTPIATMWKDGERRCLILVTQEQFSVRLLEGDAILQDVGVASAAAAIRTAEIWAIEHQRDARHALSADSH